MVCAVNFTRQHRNEDVGYSVVVVVLKNGSHSRKRLAVCRECGTRIESTLGERAGAVIVKKILLHAIVSDEDVSEAVIVVIGKGGSQRAALLCGNARFFADILECSVSAIAVEEVGSGGEFRRRTVGAPGASAGLAVPRVPFHVAGDKKV